MLPKILAGKDADEQVRLWVPGCATGEEVYSLAILLKELMGRAADAPKVQIFGTDIDDMAIAIARAARYRRAGAGRRLARARLRAVVRRGWRRPTARSSEIREMCVFSLHSVIKDPPFSKLDMISCRNLLIYLDGELQDRVIRNFHYALQPGRLAVPRTVGERGAQRRPVPQIDKRHRIFQRRDSARRYCPVSHRAASCRPVPRIRRTAAYRFASLDDALDRSARRALEQYSPAYVVIDRACNIVRFSGGAVGRFLEPSPGAANLNLFGILHGRCAVQCALLSKRRSRITRRSSRRAAARLDGHTHLITLIAQPISDGASGRDRYLVAFHDTGLARGPTARAPGPAYDACGDDERVLAQELAATRSQLRRPSPNWRRERGATILQRGIPVHQRRAAGHQ